MEEGAAGKYCCHQQDLGEASWRDGAGHGERADPEELKLGRKGILNAGELLGKAGDAMNVKRSSGEGTLLRPASATQRPLLRQPDEGLDPVAGQLQLGLPRPGAGPPVPRYCSDGSLFERQHRAVRPRRAAQYLNVLIYLALPLAACNYIERQPEQAEVRCCTAYDLEVADSNAGEDSMVQQPRAAGFSPAALARQSDQPTSKLKVAVVLDTTPDGDQPRPRLRAITSMPTHPPTCCPSSKEH